MKNRLSYFFLVLLLQVSLSAFATDYYCIKSGNAANPSTWNSSRSGNGTVPTSFNDPNDNFIVQDGFSVSGNANFSCKGSLIIEKGGIYQTGNTGNVTSIASFVTINDGATLQLTSRTTLIAGFILVQGVLQNLGGEIRLNPALATR